MSVGFPSRDNDDAAILDSCSSALATIGDNFYNEACSDNAREALPFRTYNMRQEKGWNLGVIVFFGGGRCFAESDTSVCAEWMPRVITRQIFGGDKRKIEVFAPEVFFKRISLHEGERWGPGGSAE